MRASGLGARSIRQNSKALMSLLVVGSLALDIIETPFERRDQALGGSATFIALAASYFCPEKLGVVGVVGEDFPEHAWNLFRRRAIDTAGIQVVPGGKTFSWHGKYHYDMNTRDTIATNLKDRKSTRLNSSHGYISYA